MTDLERIRFIEETFGFKLHHVPIEKLGTENIFYVKFSILINFSGIEDGNFYYRGARNYSTDSKGNVTGLELDFSPVYLLPRKLLSEFYFLKQLRLKNSFLGDVAFLKTLKNLTSLDLSYNKKIKDYSFLKNLKNLTSLDLSDNGLSDVSFLKDLKNINTLVLSNNKEIKDYSFLKKLRVLTSLDLCSNDLNDISFLEELKSITSLYLNINNLRDVSYLRNLKNITLLDLRRNSLSNKGLPLEELERINSLYLGYNDIKDIAFLDKFKNLSILDLRRNNLSDISSLRNLKELSFVDLSYNSINDISFIIDHKKIRDLSLRGNNLNNLSCLSNLKSISSLDISDNNQIKDYSFLKPLNDINSLDLRKNNLNDISFLENIENLLFLDLSYNNQITDYSILKKLKRLTSLNLNHNNLSDISFLKKLKNLTTLDLGKNHLINVSSLENLKKLNSLVINYNKIKDIAFLENLKEIRSLDLRRNEIADASSLKNLKDIVSVDLSGNRLRDVSFLQELKSLTSLDLSFNYLNDVSYLKEIKGLSSLGLCDNYISDVSFINELKGINKIDFSRNPIEGPPQEIIEKGIEAIQEYFRQAEKYETEKAYEAKILIIGEPGAGKTTLMELLFNESHPVPSPERTQPSTLGIEVKPNRLFKQPNKELPEVKAHIWDFGGQDIQYALHQYFLTDDSVYILLTDGRSGKTRYGYWFHIIGLLGKKSPILVLLNRRKGQDTIIPFDSKLYKETFPNLKIIDLGEIDFGDLRHNWANLINELAANLSALPIVGQQTLKPWKPIREAIEKLQYKKHIPLEEFESICYQNGLEDPKEVRFLLDYFHKIGVALNYEEETLQNTVFLDPNWITHAIYDVLSDDKIIDRNGQFHKNQLYEHWQKKQCDKKHKQAYSLPECNYLLNLMQKNQFEVCYPIVGKPSFYIVPMKLPDRRPDYAFDTTNNLRFRYQYPFMPEGLLSRLIVRMHEYIEDGKVWLTGALFCENGCIAEVLQQETTQEGIKYIGVRISGADLYKRQQLLRNIRREVEHIHRNTFPYINFSEMVVCNCSKCAEHPTPNFYAYEDLQTYLEAKEKEIFCTVGKHRVDIRRMIDGVYPPDDFDREGNKKPVEPKPEQKMKTIKIFLASSAELSEDRKEFENFIGRKNKEYIKQGVFLELVIWEDFIDAMSATRLQDEYDKAIEGCDIFVSIFHTKVGKFTNEEFDVALKSFKATKKPLIYTYFNDTPISMSKITPEINTLFNFKQKLIDLGHFPTIYNNIEDLKYKFGEQLVKILKPPLL